MDRCSEIGLSFGLDSMIAPHEPETIRAGRNAQLERVLGCTILATMLFLINIIWIAGGISCPRLTVLLLECSLGSHSKDSDSSRLDHCHLGFGLLPVLTLWVSSWRKRAKGRLCSLPYCDFVSVVCLATGLVMAAFSGCTTLFLLRSRDRRFLKIGQAFSFAALGIVLLIAVMSLKILGSNAGWV